MKFVRILGKQNLELFMVKQIVFVVMSMQATCTLMYDSRGEYCSNNSHTHVSLSFQECNSLVAQASPLFTLFMINVLLPDYC